MPGAFGLCLALTLHAAAQNGQDTIAVTPLPGAKVFVVGNGMSRLLKEANFELLKNSFIADMKQAAADSDFVAAPTEAVYFIAKDGRRRLKLKPEEPFAFDVQAEIKAFEKALPPVHYTLYDLPHNMEYHIYLKEASQLYQLADVNFVLMNRSIATQLPKPDQYTRIDAEADKKDWRVTADAARPNDWIELYPSVGVGMFNSTLAPAAAVHADVVFVNKYRTPGFKVASSATLYALGDYQDFQFRNVYAVAGYDVRLMRNFGPQKQPYWFGALFGRLKAPGLSDTVKASLRNRIKLGVAFETRSFAADFSFLLAKAGEPAMHNLTFRFRF